MVQTGLRDDRWPPEGALDELVRDTRSRAQFLKMVGGAGAIGAFSMLVAGCGSTQKDNGNAETDTDIDIVQYALTLEYLEADFYKQVVDAKAIKTRKYAELAKYIGAEEQEHVDSLTAAVKSLGAVPVAKPQTKFATVLAGGEKKILVTAAAVENLGAAAYLGQAANVKSKEVLAAALAIHTNEARHAAILNFATGQKYLPDGAFGKGLDKAAVLKVAGQFIVS